MDITGRTVLILGGAGLVGMAVARKLLDLSPSKIVVGGLTRREAEEAVATLRGECEGREAPPLDAVWGDIFLPEAVKEKRRAEILAQPESRALVLDELYADMTDEVLSNSTLGALLLRVRPDVIVDCVNTATAFAYQNVFSAAARMRTAANTGSVAPEEVERLLATLYLPQLIRHVQIALEGMKRAGTSFYLKVGTAGTGGMGLNIPFTHSEERPSRMLLAKSSLAGAHTLLLYLMARTDGAPTIKEVKPTAAISWKRIGYGEIRRSGAPIECYDALAPVAVENAFNGNGERVSAPTGAKLQGVFVDAGENGLFTAGEFETLTALGLMEFITPEEIAEDVVREIRGQPTGHDIVAALDGATSGPTYRAGVMREVALERMERLEQEKGVDAVAYEMLGPPRLSKLLFEGNILARLYGGLDEAARLDPETTAERAEALIDANADLRVRILSIGLPILLADGRRLLRGPDVKCPPGPGASPDVARLADAGWVDLRPENWERWRGRLVAIRDELARAPGAEFGSRSDLAPGDRRRRLRPGSLAAWIFRNEDGGARIKR